MKEPILCHCCTKNQSATDSICCPQICYRFLSCPQDTRKKSESQLQQWGIPTCDCNIWAL